MSWVFISSSGALFAGHLPPLGSVVYREKQPFLEVLKVVLAELGEMLEKLSL